MLFGESAFLLKWNLPFSPSNEKTENGNKIFFNLNLISMKNVIVLLCILIFCFSNCKNEMEEFKNGFRLPDVELSFELKNSESENLLTENCFDCYLLVNEQEPSLSQSTCGEIAYSVASQNNTLTIHFEENISIQNVNWFATLFGVMIYDFEWQAELNLLQVHIPSEFLENIMELGFQLSLEICEEENKLCPYTFSGFVEFPAQTIFVDYPNLQNQIPICTNQLCVEVEEGYFSIRSHTLKICTTESVKVSNFYCDSFSPSDIQFIQSSGFTEIRCYMSSEFWECWNNIPNNQQGYYSISISFEHANPIVL